jgi:DNA modification methylase
VRKEVIGSATLYLGDCLQVMSTLARVDAVITDPPYGLGEARKDHKSRNKLAGSPTYERGSWDDAPASTEAIDHIRRLSETQVIFGGNYFQLPPAKCWLIWDKINGENDFADAEMAWTNINGAVRLIRHMWAGMLRDSERTEPRVHPTQKPIAVMAWAIDKAKLKPNSLILDPYMGSGTTGVAALQAKHRFIGIEAHEPYFDAACIRIENAQRQEALFA